MSDLLVDITVLQRLRAGLSDAAASLEQLGRALARASTDDLGDRRIDDAAGDFFRRWGYGTEQLGEAAEVVGKQVDEALRVYEKADADLGAIFRSES